MNRYTNVEVNVSDSQKNFKKAIAAGCALNLRLSHDNLHCVPKKHVTTFSMIS